MVEQNIPGLLPNTTYTVRVIAINCAGSSGVVAVNATTANNATQPPLPSLIPVGVGVGFGVGIGVGVGVGVPLILVIIAVVMMLYKSCHPTKSSNHEEAVQLQPAQKKATLCLSELPQGMFPALGQIFIIVCNDTPHRGQVFELGNMWFVFLKERQTPPSSSDQLWCRKDGPDESFTIVSMSNGRALKRDPESSQIMLSEEGDQWMMEGNNIVCKLMSTMLFCNEKSVLYCYNKGFNETKHSFTFQKMVCSC